PNRALPRHRRVSVYKRLRKIRFVRRGVIFLRGESLTFRYVALHLFAAVPVQTVPGVKQIERCAEQRIDSFCAGTSQGMTASFHPLPWSMRQVICRELELL